MAEVGSSPVAPLSSSAVASSWPDVLTWSAYAAPRMESVRIQLNGKRLKAAGRIIGADCADHPAFSASYDLVTDENGATRRLSLRTSLASGERVVSISRDSEGYWLVNDGEKSIRSEFGGALDVDVILSPFFNTLPIRRMDLHARPDDVSVPVVYVSLPDLAVREETLTYSSAADGIHLISPVATATVTVDSDGFLVDYPGLGRRL